MLFSELVNELDNETKRRIYSLFTRAVSRGDVPALKLLDKMTVTTRAGQTRSVQDFVIPNSAAEQVADWIRSNLQKPANRSGLTAQVAQSMTDAELLELIQKKHQPKKPRKPRTRRVTE